MLRILDLSWQRLMVVETVRPTISRLRDVTVTADRLPIVMDASTRSSALVLTNVLDWAQLHLSLPETSSSMDTGLWDIIRKNQIAVHQDQPALLVAQMASETLESLVQPTRFGNVLAAGESRTIHRYNISAEFLWPRLTLLAHNDRLR